MTHQYARFPCNFVNHLTISGGMGGPIPGRCFVSVPDDVAGELGLGDPKALTGMIQANPRIRDLGLGPFLRGAAIKRTLWESLDGGRFLSTFQRVSRELDLGTPFRSF